MTVETSHDPRTGDALAEVPVSDSDAVLAAVASAEQAAPALAATPPAERSRWLHAIAEALVQPEVARELVELADAETALGETRLTGELARAASQLRFYGGVAEEGSFLDVALDSATEVTPELRRMQVPLGPVAIFGASNFPFAFGVLGNDTASALAAGCPVVVKVHPAHPQLSVRLIDLAQKALADSGAPDGTLSHVVGFHAGGKLVRSDGVCAVAFTGSQRGGLALWRMANERRVVIPVFAEMGTVNPVVVTSAAGASMAEIARGFVGSFTMGSGQFCTKPGLLIVPASCDAVRNVADALEAAAPQGWALTMDIALQAAAGVSDLVSAGASVVAQVPGPDPGWSVPATVLAVPASTLKAGSRLLEECFGPVALVSEYADAGELEHVLDELPGALAGAVMTAGPGDPETAGIVARLVRTVGRVAENQWPTGVAFSWAQQHGGPWPATSAPATTSVGAAALDRFVRPITFQAVSEDALPAAVQIDNPWGVPRRVDGVRS